MSICQLQNTLINTEIIHESIENIIEEKQNSCKVFIGDWNLTVAEDVDGKVMGKYGLERWNGMKRQ